MPSASRGSGPQVHEAGLECGSTGAHGVRVVVARSRRVWGCRSVRTRAPRPRQIRAQPANLVFFLSNGFRRRRGYGSHVPVIRDTN